MQLVRNIGHLTAGELENEIEPRLVRRRDEIGAVARATAVFREAMRQNMRAVGERERVRETTETEKRQALRNLVDGIELETTKVTEQTADTGSALVSRGQYLAASAARVMASVNSVTEASATALERSLVVSAAGEELSVSALEIVGQINSSAAEIASTARLGERAQQIIGHLSGAVDQIGAVARLIGDIAARTNLLALNATIEAARAGHAGRGFTVVANEVKLLATQTARSTEEISRNANAIQLATRDVVRVVGEMVERVTSIERVTQLVAAAAKQQTSATGEIARNVAESAEAMRVVSEQTHAMTEEAHAADVAVAEMRELAETVSAHISDLRTAMVRILRNSSSEVNRREHQRTELNMPAVLVLNGLDLPATCINLSYNGARVRVARRLEAGCDVILRLPGLPKISGQVLHDGEEVGIIFGWEKNSAPPALTMLLEQRSAA